MKGIKHYPMFDNRSFRFSATKITVHVPSTIEKNKKISSRKFKQRIVNTVRTMTEGDKKSGFSGFGGTTRFSGYGTFVSQEGKTKGKTIGEKVGVVESFVWHDSLTQKQKREFSKYIENKAKEWKQESVFVSVESPKKTAEVVYFVKPPEESSMKKKA